MDFGILAAVISTIVIFYAVLLWYAATRWLIRIVQDKPQRAQRVEVLFVNQAKLK